MDEKDRYGDKLHDVEHAREEQWAHQRDQELLEKLRKKGEDALCARSAASHWWPRRAPASR